MFKNYFIKSVLCICFIFQFAGCSKSDSQQQVNVKESDEYLYSAFLPGRERSWGSVEVAQQSPRMNGMIELSKYVDKPQTAEQKKKADDLYNNLIKSIKENGWLNRENALKDGYLYEENRDRTHYHNYQYVFDGEDLNPQKPEVLMYYPTSDGRYLLTGVMFLKSNPFEHGEQIGGHETVWHYHHYEKGYCESFDFEKWGLKDPEIIEQFKKSAAKGGCKDGFYIERSPEMIHVWIIDHPQGRFASTMGVEEKWLYTGLNKPSN